MSYLFNDLVGFKSNSVDAFNRLKVSAFHIIRLTAQISNE